MNPSPAALAKANALVTYACADVDADDRERFTHWVNHTHLGGSVALALTEQMREIERLSINHCATHSSAPLLSVCNACDDAEIRDAQQIERATWKTAAKICDEIVERHRKQNSCGRDVFCEDFGCADFEALANTFRARVTGTP
jgi:hypothetical protein